MFKIVAILLVSCSMLLAEDKPTSQVSTAPITQTAPKPDTAKVIKARFKSYKIQQKHAMRLAKAQTKLALEQQLYNEKTAEGTRNVAAEQAKQK